MTLPEKTKPKQNRNCSWAPQGRREEKGKHGARLQAPKAAAGTRAWGPAQGPPSYWHADERGALSLWLTPKPVLGKKEKEKGKKKPIFVGLFMCN